MLASQFAFQAHGSSQINDEIATCSKEKQSAARLACYDDIASKMAEIVSESKQQLKQQFGKIQAHPADSIEKLYMTIAKIKKDPYGAMIITFDNDQVWKQTQTRRYRLKTGNKIYIERGALGSFMLGQDETNNQIRVKRIK